MKIFVHLLDEENGSASPAALSARITLTPALVTLDDVLRAFCALHTRKRHQTPPLESPTSSAPAAAAPALTPSDVVVFTERELEGNARVAFSDDKRAQRWFARRQKCPGAATADGDDECDFELVLVRARSPLATVTESNSSVAATTSAATPKHLQLSTTASNLAAVVALGVQHLQQRKLRAAKTLFETLVLPLDPTNVQALIAMGDIHAANQRFDVAVTHWYKKCWDTVLPDHKSCRDTSVNSEALFRDAAHAQLVIDCGLKIAHCEVQRGCYREALQIIETLQRMLQQRESRSGSALISTPLVEKKALDVRMDLLKAQALYALRSASPELQDAAVALLTKLLPDLQSPNLNLDALLLYSTIAFDCGKKSDALNMVLRVLVGRPDDKEVRQQLARIVGDNGGMQLLGQAVPPEGGPSSAAAYAFIGTILKDFGVLEASVECFERAEHGNPVSPAYALNHAHVLEVCSEYERAFSVLVSFFRRNPALSTGGGQLVSREILRALEIDGWVSKGTGQQQSKEETWRIEWLSSDSGGRAVVYLNDKETVPACSSSSISKNGTPSLLQQDELDLLACFFAVVKVRSDYRHVVRESCRVRRSALATRVSHAGCGRSCS